MALSQYNFNTLCNPKILNREILSSSIVKTLSHIETKSSPITTSVYFEEELSSQEETTLGDIITNHNPSPIITEDVSQFGVYLPATNRVTTSSGTYSTIQGMSYTPDEGIYLIIFTGSFSTASNNADGNIAIFIDNNIIQESVRRIRIDISVLLGSIGNSTFGYGIPMAKISVNGRQNVSTKFKVNSRTLACEARSMIFIRVL